MKTALPILALLIAILTSSTRAQSWDVARHGGGAGNDYGSRVALDADGNSYVTGELFGAATFDDASAVGSRGWSVYLAKYSPSGTLLWAKTIATAADSAADIYARALGVDRGGSIYLAGSFVSRVNFSATTLESAGPTDIYLAKLNGEGELQWVRRAGGVGVGTYGRDEARGLALDGAGNCYITGTYNRDATFDSIAITGSTTMEMFIAKYDGAGRALWAVSGGAIGISHVATAIAIDSTGDCYVTGTFFNKLALGGDTLDAIDPEQKMFIAKIGSNGTVKWARKIGSGGYYGTAMDVGVNRDGEAIISGNFRANIILGDVEYVYDNTAYAMLALAYDGDGNFIWATRTTGSSQNASGKKIAIDADGRIFITGGFLHGVEFGSATLTSDVPEGFVASLDRDGRFIGVTPIIGTTSAVGNDIVRTGDGASLVVGTFAGTLDLPPHHLSSAGGGDMFLARLRDQATSVQSDPRSHALPFRLSFGKSE